MGIIPKKLEMKDTFSNFRHSADNFFILPYIIPIFGILYRQPAAGNPQILTACVVQSA